MATVQDVVFHSIRNENGWQVEVSGKPISRHLTQNDTENAVIANCRAVFLSGGTARAVFHESDGDVREERIFEKDRTGQPRGGRRGRRVTPAE